MTDGNHGTEDVGWMQVKSGVGLELVVQLSSPACGTRAHRTAIGLWVSPTPPMLHAGPGT